MVGTRSTCVDKLVFSAVHFTFGRGVSVSMTKSQWRGMLTENPPGDIFLINCIYSQRSLIYSTRTLPHCCSLHRVFWGFVEFSSRERIFEIGFDCNRRLTENFSRCREDRLFGGVSLLPLVDHQTKIITDLRSHVRGAY